MRTWHSAAVCPCHSAETSARAAQRNQSVRDLTKLNRDLSRVVFVVAASKADSVEPADNVLVIPDMDPSDSNDHTLTDLLPMLELIVMRGVPDARAVCRSYAGKDIAAEFRRRVRPQEAPRRCRLFGGG
jgi:NLI interacting factor-like phosphatase